MHNPFLYLLGVIGVVAMWRGLGGLMDMYLWPKRLLLSYLVSLVAGFAVVLIVLRLVAQ